MSQEQRQQAAREEKLVPSADRVKISATNMRIEPTMPQKEETFQFILGIIKASPCFKAFTITADVPEIYMQQFWLIIKKTKKTSFYEFGLSDKKFSVDVELFRKILDICPRVPNEEFVAPQSEEDLLAFLIELGYKGPLDHLAKMKNVDYHELIWEDFTYQIDYKQAKLRRRPSSGMHIIKDDGVISRLKFVRIGEDFQEYGRAIPKTMLTEGIKQSEAYQSFIKYFTGLIPSKKSRGKGSQGKKRKSKKKVSISADDNIIPEPDFALELGKSISLAEAKEEEAARRVHATHERLVLESDEPSGEPANRPTGRRRTYGITC
ncbi:hypothetical protein Tco_0126601 [Tanacetum coccineum]